MGGGSRPARDGQPASPASLIRRLLAWYDRDRRRLPWRAEPGSAADPYHVLLSEFMLQQTTVATVSRRFPEFLARFPSLEALAAADQTEVLHAWQGLGYYRRARALHALARTVVVRHHGRLPTDAAALRALPGIGPYTASALGAIAFGQPAVPVDGNVLRVLARLHRVETPLPAALPELNARAAALATDRRPADVAQALMDLGATLCRPRAPRCAVCPWREACAAHAAGIAGQLPRRAARPARPVRRGLAFLLARPDGAILFRRRPAIRYSSRRAAARTAFAGGGAALTGALRGAAAGGVRRALTGAPPLTGLRRGCQLLEAIFGVVLHALELHLQHLVLVLQLFDRAGQLPQRVLDAVDAHIDVVGIAPGLGQFRLPLLRRRLLLLLLLLLLPAAVEQIIEKIAGALLRTRGTGREHERRDKNGDRERAPKLHAVTETCHRRIRCQNARIRG